MQPPARSKKISWLANQPLQRKMMLALGLLLGLFLATSVVTLNSLRQQENNRRWATHTYQVLLQLHHVRSALQASQIGARGYVLTQRADQLAMFDNATDGLRERMGVLHEMTADNPLQQSRIDSLKNMMSRWQRELRTWTTDPITHRKTADSTSMALELQRIRSRYLERRTVRTEEMYAVLDRMIAVENGLLAVRNDQLDRALAATRLINAAAVLLGILLGILVIRLTSQLITRPLRRLTDLMTRLSNHEHDFEIRRLDRRDEVGEIARALQVFKQMSLNTQSQAWIRSQVSAISQVLLQATTHKEFAQWLASELVPLCKAGVGLFYSFDDARHRLDLLGSYGVRMSDRSADYLAGKALVGQCARERKAIMLDNVPENYLHIECGSGEALPHYVAIVPVLYRDTLIGVLELAGFVPLTTLQQQLLDELLPIVALALENLNHAISTHDLLLQTREQADDLRVSELVMRQQKEVLRHNNDALRAKTSELEEQSERLIASEEELRVQAEQLQASNEELRDKTESLNRQKYVLEDLQQETADKAAQLALASQYKSEFLANMSHELRTPLNSLLILSRSLADNGTGNLDGEQIESARIIHDAGNSLLYLINDILDLSKVEAGKMELVIDDLLLTDLIQRLRRTFAPVAEDKGLGFTLDIDAGLPSSLRTDGGKLEQIVNNLLSNAFKFTASGTVSLRLGRAGPDVVVPEALLGQPLIALTVSDTGIGIAPDKFQRVFNAFEQVDAGTSRQFGGTGLGLAISQRMAQLLHGDVVLRSESGRGSRFTVLLPEIPPAPSEVAADVPHADGVRFGRAKSPYPLPEMIEDDRGSLRPEEVSILVIMDAGSPARFELTGHRVLLLDDDMRNLFALSRVMRGWGLQVALAQDGHKALKMLADDEAPELVLMDVMMPGMDGYETIRAIREQPRFANLPIIALTANAMRGDRERCLEMGASDYLSKPIDIDRLAALIRAWLQR